MASKKKSSKSLQAKLKIAKAIEMAASKAYAAAEKAHEKAQKAYEKADLKYTKASNKVDAIQEAIVEAEQKN